MKIRTKLFAAAALSTACFAQPASAALTVFNTYTGNFGLSTDGGGSNASTYQVSAFVPIGATVVAAFLYQSTLNSVIAPQAVTLNGSALSFSPLVINPTYSSLGSARANVTSLVAGVVNGGAGGTYNFNVGETGANVDGTALVVVYDLASLGTSTVAILDGFSAITGDTTTLNFAAPLNPLAPGFTAEMRLGIGFSINGQASTVSVNNTVITRNAGNNDDGFGTGADGQLITVGGSDDPFSTFLPTYENDHERYDLKNYITAGDTSIKIDTINPSNNDNIFLAAFRVSGRAVVTSSVPEPGTWSLLIAGFGLIGTRLRRATRRLTAQTA